MADAKQKIQTSYSIWHDKFDAAYDKFTADLEGMVKTMQAQGVADEIILAKINSMIADDSDVMGAFSGDIEKYADDLVSIAAQTIANDYNAEELLNWVLDPTADNCDGCIERANRPPMTFAEHEAEGTPGNADTECGIYCKCSLEKAS